MPSTTMRHATSIIDGMVPASELSSRKSNNIFDELTILGLKWLIDLNQTPSLYRLSSGLTSSQHTVESHEPETINHHAFLVRPRKVLADSNQLLLLAGLHALWLRPRRVWGHSAEQKLAQSVRSSE